MSSASPCCPVGARPDAAALDAALRAAKAGAPGAESLNAIHRRTGVRKEALIRHRDQCGTGSSGSDRPPAGGPLTLESTGEPAEPGSEPPRGSIFAVPNPGDDAMTAPRKLISAEVERDCLRLRVKGKSYEAIAAEVGVSEDAAMDAVERVLLRTRGKADHMAEAARALEVARCDAIIAAFWERATDPAMATVMVPADTESGMRPYDGQDKAADRLLKAMERRAKLLGLDAPTGPAVQINLVNAPGFKELVNGVLGALIQFPDAMAAVKTSIRETIAARRGLPR